MITTITGRLVEKSPTELVVECNGLGYLINISLNTFSKLGNDENIRLYTYLQVKEDSHTLFGFFDKKERNLFYLTGKIIEWNTQWVYLFTILEQKENMKI